MSQLQLRCAFCAFLDISAGWSKRPCPVVMTTSAVSFGHEATQLRSGPPREWRMDCQSLLCRPVRAKDNRISMSWPKQFRAVTYRLNLTHQEEAQKRGKWMGRGGQQIYTSKQFKTQDCHVYIISLIGAERALVYTSLVRTIRVREFDSAKQNDHRTVWWCNKPLCWWKLSQWRCLIPGYTWLYQDMWAGFFECKMSRHNSMNLSGSDQKVVSLRVAPKQAHRSASLRHRLT